MTCVGQRVREMLGVGLLRFVDIGCVATPSCTSVLDVNDLVWDEVVDRLVRARILSSDDQTKFSALKVMGAVLRGKKRVLRCLNGSCQRYVQDANRYVVTLTPTPADTGAGSGSVTAARPVICRCVSLCVAACRCT